MTSIKTFTIPFLFTLLISYAPVWAQSPKAVHATFALTHATLVTVTKGTITDGTLVIADGKIKALGTNVTIPAGATVIDCAGKRVYPGMIDGGTQVGITEIGSDPRTHDYNEVGKVVPQMKALTAVNPNSVIIPVTRVNGVTTVLSCPSGGRFSGTAALINLHGYTPDQMYAGFEGIIMNFPPVGRRNRWDRRSDEEISKEHKAQMKHLNDVWDKVAQYHKLDSANPGKIDYYPELQALLPVYRGEMALLIEVNVASDIRGALEWVAQKKIKKVVLTGVEEGWRAAEAIAQAGIPVVVGPVIALPSRRYDRYDKAFANAGLMQKAGVKVAIRSAESENTRNLPYHAGFAAAYGMDKAEALKAITINPAEIFGVSDRLGSLEVGKSATLFVCDGDPLEPATHVTQVFIEGWEIPMVSRQTALYNEFLDRSPGLSKQ